MLVAKTSDLRLLSFTNSHGVSILIFMTCLIAGLSLEVVLQNMERVPRAGEMVDILSNWLNCAISLSAEEAQATFNHVKPP